MNVKLVSNNILTRMALNYGASSSIFKNQITLDPTTLCRANCNIIDNEIGNWLQITLSRFDILYRSCLGKNFTSYKDMLNVHELLGNNDQHFGRIRNSGVIVGKNLKVGNLSCSFKPMASKLVPNSLSEWIKLDEDSIPKIFYKYFRFINIHPFMDGNGRFGRAYIMSRNSDLTYFPLFLLQNNGKMHNELVRNTIDSQGFQEVEKYSNEYCLWVNRLNSESEALLEEFKVFYGRKLILHRHGDDFFRVCEYLFDKPFFTKNQLCLKFVQLDKVYLMLCQMDLIECVIDGHKQSAALMVFVPGLEHLYKITKLVRNEVVP